MPSSRTDCPGASQRVRLLLSQGRRFRGNVYRTGGGVRAPCLLIQPLAGRGERLHEQRSDLRRQPPAHDHHAVLVLIHVQRPAPVAPRGLAGLGQPVHPSPPTNDPLDVRGSAGPPARTFA